MITNTVHEYQCHGQSKRHLLVSIRIMKLFTVVSIIIKSGFGKLFMSPASAQEKRFLSPSSYSYQSQQKQYKPRISNKVTPKWSRLRLKKTKMNYFYNVTSSIFHNMLENSLWISSNLYNCVINIVLPVSYFPILHLLENFLF